MGEITSMFFNVTKDFVHSLSNEKGLNFTRKSVRGLTILEKSLMNLR